MIGLPALEPARASDCKSEATVSLGNKPNWHLCASCAALPEFKRFTKRHAIGGANRKQA